MKTKAILAIAMSALTLVACKKSNNNSSETNPSGGEGASEVTALTLDKDQASIKVGETLQLTATVTPADATITWSSTDATKATVDDKGLVTGVAEGRAMIMAKAGDKTAGCIITVGEVEDDLITKMQPYLEGSDYYLFAMGEKTSAKLQSGAIKQDLRIDGGYEGETIPETTHALLEVWDNSFEGGQGGGLNSFGLLEDYISLVSSYGVWGSAGYGGLRQINRTVDLSDIADHKDEYTLVITYKCSANNANDGVKFTLESTVGDGKVEIPVSGNTGGDWAVVEKPMASLFKQGLDWSQAWSADKKAAFYPFELFIDKVGQGLDVDAIFVYKAKK